MTIPRCHNCESIKTKSQLIFLKALLVKTKQIKKTQKASISFEANPHITYRKNSSNTYAKEMS